jgi:hypothetical protein
MNERIPGLVAQAEQLSGNVSALAAEVGALRTSNRHMRQIVGAIAAVLALVVLVAVVLVFVAADAREASRRAEAANSLSERNAQAQKVSCESGNEARRVNRQLWTYVLDLSSKNPNLTAEQHRQIRTFRGYLVTVYADRDCNSDHPTPLPSPPSPSR